MDGIWFRLVNFILRIKTYDCMGSLGHHYCSASKLIFLKGLEAFNLLKTSYLLLGFKNKL